MIIMVIIRRSYGAGDFEKLHYKANFTEVISNHSNSVGFVDYRYYWCGWYVLCEE